MPLVSVTLSQSPLGLLWYPLGHLELPEEDDVDESVLPLLPPSSSSSPPSPSPPSSAPPPFSSFTPPESSGALLPLSHPMPSLSLSNPCGSGDNTLKLVPSTSSQFKSGGLGGMQKSGYEESHAASPSSPSPSVCPTGASGAIGCATSGAIGCATSGAAINSNESNTCPTTGGNGVGAKLPDAAVAVVISAAAVLVVELPS